MTTTFTDVVQRKAVRPAFFLELGDFDGSGLPNPNGLVLSDYSHALGTTRSFLPLVLAWDVVEWGADPWLPAVVPEGQLKIGLSRGTLAALPNYPGDLFQYLQTRAIVGMRVRLYFALSDMANTYSGGVYSGGPRLLFQGRVLDVDDITDAGLSIFCTHDQEIDLDAAIPVARFDHEVPDVSKADIVPLITGRVGWDWQYWIENHGSFTSGAADMVRFVVSDYATPCVIWDVPERRVRASVGEINGTAVNNGGLWCKFDEQRHSFRVDIGDFIAEGILDLQEITPGTFGVPSNTTDDWVLAFCFNAPQNALDEAGDWTHPERAFTANLHEYAEFDFVDIPGQSDNHPLYGNGLFIEMPIGSGAVITPTQGGDARLVALIELTHAETVRIKLDLASTEVHSDLSLAAGRHVITLDLDDTYSAVIDDAAFGSFTHQLALSIPSPTAGHKLRVYSFGVYFETQIKMKHLFARDAYSFDATSDNWHEPTKFFYSGLAGNSTETAPNDSAIREFLLAGTARAKDPLVSGDFQSGTGVVGSFDDLETDLETARNPYTICCVSTEAHESVRSALTHVSENLFIWIRKGIGWNTAKYGAAMRKIDAPSSGSVFLYAHQIQEGSLAFSAIPGDLVRNAVYYDFGHDYISGDYRERVFIDGDRSLTSTFVGPEFGTDTTREAIAADSQDLYGYRPVNIQSSSVNSPAVAQEICNRIFDALNGKRIQITFRATLDFLDLVQPGYTFTADVGLDTIMPLPISQDVVTSWQNTLWTITRIHMTPYDLATITAVQAHATSGLP